MLNQEEGNRYRPYFDKFEISNYSPEFLDVTSIYISKNAEIQIDDTANSAKRDIKKMAATLSSMRDNSNTENSNKPKV